MSGGLALRQVATAAVALGALFWAGWLAPTQTEVGVPAAVTPGAPVFVHPGAVLAEASRRFGLEVVGADADGVADIEDRSIDVTGVTMVKAQAVDVSETFRRELSAVIAENGSHVVLLKAPGEGARRVNTGAPYRDGWRVASISSNAIVLRKRREERVVPVIGAYEQASDTTVVAATSAPDHAERPRLVLLRQDARARKQ